MKKIFNIILAVLIGGLHSQLASKMPNALGIWDTVLETYGLDCMEGSTFFKDWRTYYIKSVPEYAFFQFYHSKK